jgi:hypothetical protein
MAEDGVDDDGSGEDGYEGHLHLACVAGEGGATANPGCMLGLMRGGFGGRVEHPVSLLYRALRYE